MKQRYPQTDCRRNGDAAPLRIIDLANEAQNGVKVDWHVREAVTRSMGELGELYAAPVGVVDIH